MTVCIVCRHQEGDIVCKDDRSGLAKMIAALPGRVERLSLMLMPGQGSSEPRVSTSRTAASIPSALSLLAGGNDQVSGMLHPLVRRWQTLRKATVSRVVFAGGVATIVEEETELVEWHRELVRDPAGRIVEVPDDDQIGMLPPREWLDTQVRFWRLKLGDHVPSRTPGAIAHRSYDQDGRSVVTMWPASLPHGNAKTARVTALQVASMLSTAYGRQVYSLLHAVEWYWQRQVNARLGLYPEVSPVDRPIDPLQEDIEARFGEPPRSLAMAWDVKYLLTHLDVACDRGDELGIDAFAAELQALTAEIQRVLGDEQKQIWIGRCPAFLTDVDSEVRYPCGAGLWQEDGWAQVKCPHCHTTWDTRGPAGRSMAREIHKVWPIDRRRRYSAEDMAAAMPPRCPTCAQRVIIEWREVTGTDDVRERRRWWQPRTSRCESGCANAGRAL